MYQEEKFRQWLQSLAVNRRRVDVLVLVQKSSGGVLLPKSAVKFERYLTGEVKLCSLLTCYKDLRRNN